jgi:DNA helicase-2/ATP-dependent DNA helicase PcrA
MAMNREKINQKFREEYGWLNEQQKLAVDTIEGPVMVIAGPGTGKTQILGARVGKILLETDTSPENILCLTYTDAGVLAMRRRLLSFIGPDAYKVNIYTFHAFCNEIIQENLSLFEKTSLDPISDLERIGLFKELIDSFPKDHVLKRYRGDVYYEIQNLQSLFSTMKKEGWTPAYIREKIAEYLIDLPNQEDFIYKRKSSGHHAGDLKKDKIEEEKLKMEKLEAAVNEFEKFQQFMRRRNRYDFDDMINWVIKAFEENESLIRRYQEQFLYILVDEYQDSSGTQNHIVELLISYWDKPNVFVVGDDDQSIYRFQGANLENMLAFSNNYKKDLLTVILTPNYSSTQPILDISKSLISRNEERLVNQMPGLSKELVSSNPVVRSMIHPPLIKEYETPEQELVGITLHVRQLIDQGVPAGRIAVIYKENKYGVELTRYFNLQNIPVYSKRSLNILEIPLARKIILLLKWLAAEHDIPYGGDEMLFEILHFDWFRIPPMEIAKLTVEAAELRFTENERSLRQLLFEKSHEPPKDLFSKGIHEGLKAAGVILEKLIADVPNTTLQHLFENCIREAGVLNSIMQSPDKAWQMQVLTNLFDFVKEETRRNPFISLQQLVNTLELMEKEELALPLIKISGSERGVNLLTAHGSKGLEFQYVFFAGCIASTWEKKRKPGTGYSFPKTLFISQSDQSEEEEQRRLFYVVLTRAEVHLLISYTRFRQDGKESEPSMFIAEIQEDHPLPVEKVFIDAEALTSFRSLQFSAEAPEIEQMEEDFVGRLLEKFTMNVTALNNYLRCPLEFYYKNLLRIPSPKNENTEFGSAVHYALEQLFRKML